MSDRRTLDDRELARLQEQTGASRETLETILNAAANLGIAYLLPPLRAAGHYPQWSAFALPGASKCAHLTVDDGTRALCGTPMSYNANTTIARGTTLCVGCAAHAKRLGNKAFDFERFAPAMRAAPPPPKPVFAPAPAPAPAPREPKPETSTAAIASVTTNVEPATALRTSLMPDEGSAKREPIAKRESRPAPASVDAAAPSLFDFA